MTTTQDRLSNIFATDSAPVRKDHNGNYIQHRLSLSDCAYEMLRASAPSIRLVSGTINYLMSLNSSPSLWQDNRPYYYRDEDDWQRVEDYCSIWTDPVEEQRKPRLLTINDMTLVILAKLASAFEIGISQWSPLHNGVRHTHLSTLPRLPVHAKASVALQAIGEGYLLPKHTLPTDKVELRRLVSPYPKWAYKKG